MPFLLSVWKAEFSTRSIHVVQMGTASSHIPSKFPTQHGTPPTAQSNRNLRLPLRPILKLLCPQPCGCANLLRIHVQISDTKLHDSTELGLPRVPGDVQLVLVPHQDGFIAVLRVPHAAAAAQIRVGGGRLQLLLLLLPDEQRGVPVPQPRVALGQGFFRQGHPPVHYFLTHLSKGTFRGENFLPKYTPLGRSGSAVALRSELSIPGTQAMPGRLRAGDARTQRSLRPARPRRRDARGLPAAHPAATSRCGSAGTAFVSRCPPSSSACGVGGLRGVPRMGPRRASPRHRAASGRTAFRRSRIHRCRPKRRSGSLAAHRSPPSSLRRFNLRGHSEGSRRGPPSAPQLPPPPPPSLSAPIIPITRPPSPIPALPTPRTLVARFGSVRPGPGSAPRSGGSGDASRTHHGGRSQQRGRPARGGGNGGVAPRVSERCGKAVGSRLVGTAAAP